MSIKTNFFAALVFFIVGFSSNPALADIYNRQILPVGEGEAFMANTGTGGIADTGAVYYNPAALASIAHSRMAVTGSTYLSFGIKADSVARIDTPAQDVPYQANGFNTIPASYVLTYALDHAVIAFSVLVPDSLQLENRANFTTTNTKGVIAQSYKYSDLWLGASYATRIDSEWSVGATLFGIHHAESSLVDMEVDFPNTANSIVSSINRSDVGTMGFSLNFGVLYELSKAINLGLRIQTPLLNISNRADTLINTRTVNAGVLTSTDEDHPNGSANYQLPLDTTLGARFRPADGWDIYTDLSFQVGAQYTALPDSSIDSEVSTDPTFRYAVGTRVLITEKIPARFGLFYNPSALHQFKNNGKSQTKVDCFGITGGLSYIIEHVETGVGLFYISGTGQSTSDGAPGDASKYAMTGVGALISTSYRF